MAVIADPRGSDQGVVSDRVAIERGGMVVDDRLAKRNVLVLALCQAFGGANNVVIIGTSGLSGSILAPDRALATLPASTFILGQWGSTLIVGAIAKRYGRMWAFEFGAFFAVLSGLLCAAAMMTASFPLLCTGTACGGIYAAAHQSYRFAAADTASEAFRPKAISWVMAGGVFAGIFGPQIIIWTKGFWPQYPYAASYLAQACVGLLAAMILTMVRIPKPATVGVAQGEARPLSEIFRQPRLIAAVICGVASYSMMNMMMTAAPLAMIECNHSLTDTALGLQWHVLGMFAPSFITGSLIQRFCAEKVVIAGLAMIGLAAVVGLMGITVAHFWIGLGLLGVGWNFGFIGATAMVTQCHRPAERTKVQSVNDFLVFGSMAVSSFSSGHLLATVGWGTVNEVVFPVVLVGAVVLGWSFIARRPQTRMA